MPVDDPTEFDQWAAEHDDGRWFVRYDRASWWPVLYGLLIAAGVVAFTVALVELLRAL